MKRRSLRTQLIYPLNQAIHYSHSKHRDRRNQVDTTKYIYSHRSYSCLYDFVMSIHNFIKETFPDIRWVRDITPNILQSFIDQYGQGWSSKTVKEYRCFFRKFQKLVNQTYHLNLDVSTLCFPKPERVLIRDVSMKSEHFYALCSEILNRKTKARFIPLMTYICGTRLEEACSLKPEEIDLDNKLIYLNNCKNGRNRVVPFCEDFFPAVSEIKTHCTENHWETICGNLKRDSVSRAIRTVMNKQGISELYLTTSNHAIRKLYAKRRFKEELLKEFNIEKAWSIVQTELGHNSKCRTELFRTYIGMPITIFKSLYKRNNLDQFIF